MSSDKSIARSAGIIGIATFLSRILGFVRDIIFAAFFGTEMYAQAFVVAFRIPNLLRDLIGEGAANAAVVPVLVEELTHKGKEQFWKLANILLNITLVALSALTVIGFIFARPIVIVTAFGFLDDPQKLNVTIALTRALFPYLIFIGLAAYGMGVLNSLKHFSAPAFGMSLLNISLIVCMLIWREDILGQTVGVLLGGILQVLILIPPLIKHGIVFTETKFFHPKVKKIVRLLIPRIFGSCVYQINVVVGTILASKEVIVGQGAVAALYYSSRIWQLPLAIFPIALAQAALPTLSGHIAAKELGKFRNTMNLLIRNTCFVLLPASAGLIALSVPITKVLFQRGLFSNYSTQITSSTLLFYTLGLLAYGAIKILVNGFYSMQDTRTPVNIAAVSLVVNIALSVALMYPLKLNGIALANSVSGIFNAVILFVILKKRIGNFDGHNITSSFIRMLSASVFMGVAAFWLNRYLAVLLGGIKFASLLNLSVTICVAFGIYILACHLLKVEELKEAKEWISKRR